LLNTFYPPSKLIYEKNACVCFIVHVPIPAFCNCRRTNYLLCGRCPTDNSGAGTSWATAEKELQVAIDEAVSGDSVWVKAGTYKPTSGLDRNASFGLKDGVAVYGGFTGTETQLFQRNDIYTHHDTQR
jgi:hypothetical protein